jgi:hypothetical protein
MADDKVALCTHGDALADILVALADEDHLDLGPRPPTSQRIRMVARSGPWHVRPCQLPCAQRLTPRGVAHRRRRGTSVRPR